MKWFKHETTARNDIRLKKLKKKFGLEGYGFYFTIIEIVAENIGLDLPVDQWGEISEAYDIESLCDECGIDSEKFLEMFEYCVDIGLFTASKGMPACKKIMNRLDEYAEKVKGRQSRSNVTPKVSEEAIDKVDTMSVQYTEDAPIVSGQNTDSVVHKNKIQNKNKEEDKEIDQKADAVIVDNALDVSTDNVKKLKQVPEFSLDEVKEEVEYFKNTFKLSILDDTERANQDYARKCLKKFGKEGTRAIIDVASKDKFWSTKITSFAKIWYKGVEFASLTRTNKAAVYDPNIDYAALNKQSANRMGTYGG